MDIFNSVALLLGGSWASGVNLYLSMAGLGIAHRLEWYSLPENLQVLANPFVIGIAAVLFAIEFVADKIPAVDSVWDTVHTFIRPIGGALLGWLATGDMGPILQVPAALLTGGIALESHLTKATARAAINTSPEPVSNSVASVTEDVAVGGVLYLIIAHPIIAIIIVVVLLLVSFWFLKKMSKLLKKIFGKLFGKKSANQEEATEVEEKEPKEQS